MRLAVLATMLALALAPSAQGQTAVRLAAPEDCLTNPGCGVGLKAAYGLDVSSVFVPLSVPDAGIAALDDGIAEVAVAFSTDPQVSRPDIVALGDDKAMLGPDRLVPVVRRKTIRAFGPRGSKRLVARFDAVSALLTTLQLRALNQQTNDGRLPEAVGGEFVESYGLTVRRRSRPGPRITLGFQEFTENETVAHLYAAALRAAGYRVRVVSAGGLRAEAVAKLRRGAIDGFIGYSRSLTLFLAPGTELGEDVRPELRAVLRRKVGARPLAFAPGENRNMFVVKTDTARALGLARISELARYWPAAAIRNATRRGADRLPAASTARTVAR